MRRTQAFAIDHDHFAGLNVAHVLRVDQIESTRFGSDHPCVTKPSKCERSQASRIAISSVGVRNNIENAPSVPVNTSGIASRTGLRERATPCSTTSVSEVDEKIAPSRSRRSRSSRANGRLPL